jgi:hypothetical protein
MGGMDVGAAGRSQRLGASVDSHGARWTVLRDPSGRRYCLTGRDPHTGRLPA